MNSLKVQLLLRSNHVLRVTISRDTVLIQIGGLERDATLTTVYEKLLSRVLWSSTLDDTIGTGIMVGSDKGGITLNVLRGKTQVTLSVDDEMTSISLPGEVQRIRKVDIE